MTDKIESIDCLPIISYTEKVMTQSTLPVTKVDDELKIIIGRMIKTMYKERGIGLAANQVGFPCSVIIVDVNWVKTGECNPEVLINPVITYKVGKSQAYEGCLSVPKTQWLHVPRYSNIGVDYQNLELLPQHLDAENLLARCLQHEIDHLSGKSILNYVDKTITVACCATCNAYRTTLFNVVGTDGKKTKACAEHRKDYQSWQK